MDDFDVHRKLIEGYTRLTTSSVAIRDARIGEHVVAQSQWVEQ